MFCFSGRGVNLMHPDDDKGFRISGIACGSMEVIMKFCWATINVSDMAQSTRFYSEIIGLPVESCMKPSPDMEISFLGSGETQVELIHNRNREAVSFGADICIGFQVDSLEKITSRLREEGIPIHSGPFQPNPSIRFLYIQDPDGLKVQLVEMTG